MNYPEWQKNYRLKQIRLLKNNEKVFASHLKNLRGKIDIPEEIDLAFTRKLRNSLNEYATDYGESLKEQIGKSAALQVAGATVLSATFISMMRKEHIVTTIEKGFSHIPNKVVEKAFASKLPSGLKLSERVWDLRYEQDIITMLRGGMNAGLSVEQISKTLDNFILPDRNVTTMTPYGRSLNFDSMRLARTEVMDAARSADFQMMRETPWVTGLTWEAWGANPCEECLGLSGNVYEEESDAPDTHPQCACSLIPQVISMDDWSKGIDDFMSGNDTLGIGDFLA